MSSETRYALNGDLHVAYRVLGDGPRVIIFVSNWFTNCETLPEVPSIQPWIEKMTTLGRMVFFDQPGSGISDPVSLDSPPTRVGHGARSGSRLGPILHRSRLARA